MKNFSIILAMLLASSTVFASDADMLVQMLNLKQVRAELQEKSIKTINFSKEIGSTSTTFKARIETVEYRRSTNGFYTRPCFTNVKVFSAGGIATDPYTLIPKVSTACLPATMN